MAFQALAFERKETVGVISLLQSISRQGTSRVSDELAEVCEEIAWDDTIRVVIIAGTGRDLFSIRTAPKEWRMPTMNSSIAEPLAKLKQPLIAAINGDAIGQGLELALACDVRIATEGSRFGLPDIHSGIIPFDGGTQRLPRLVGPSKALEMILTGGLIDTTEALRIGLLNRVIASDELMTMAMRLASDMASKAPLALGCVKEAIYNGMDLTLDQGLRMELDLYLLLFTTQDRTEGIKAFVEERKPIFEGR